MSVPRAAINSVVQLGDGASPIENFRDIGGVGDIKADNKAIAVDVTNQDSPDRTMEYFPAIVDPGSLAFPLILDLLDSIHQTLRGKVKSLSTFHVRFLPAGTGLARLYTVFMEDMSEEFKVKDVQRATVNMKNARSVIDL